MSNYFDAPTRKRFREALLRWYDLHKRDLPWRTNQDPYRVWVSEIMLQQTRVAVVIAYYERFIERFPDVRALARAREASVLAAWSGLGYYRRARAMHEAAKILVKRHDGRFPETAKTLEKLPGVGRYTAAAVASIAFGEPVAVVDGNVERVLDRIRGTQASIERQATKASHWDAAQDLLSQQRPGDFNQAMMEFGATVCSPANPLCGECPVIVLCKTKGAIKTTLRGLRKKKESAYAIWTERPKVYLVQRARDSSLMPGMWELPALDEKVDHVHLFTLRHSITDSDYSVSVAKQRAKRKQNGRWFPYESVSQLPLTGVTRKILAKLKIIE